MGVALKVYGVENKAVDDKAGRHTLFSDSVPYHDLLHCSKKLLADSNHERLVQETTLKAEIAASHHCSLQRRATHGASELEEMCCVHSG